MGESTDGCDSSLGCVYFVYEDPHPEGGTPTRPSARNHAPPAPPSRLQSVGPEDLPFHLDRLKRNPLAPPPLLSPPPRPPLPARPIPSRTPEQSQSYLFFWDKFEKCNYFLENVLLTKDRPLDGRLLQHLLKEPICDGGVHLVRTCMSGGRGRVWGNGSPRRSQVTIFRVSVSCMRSDTRGSGIVSRRVVSVCHCWQD